MKTRKWTLITLTVSLFFMCSASSSNATVLRAFVSSTGNDANAATNCAQSAPCKTFAGAFPTVTAGGELIALDTSGYGPIANINKAITIAAVPGQTAFVVAAGGTAAFTINGAAGDKITLRNILFNGSGAASTTGVLVSSSAKLAIENCIFTQLTTGLRATAGSIIVQHSSFSGNSSRGVHSSGTAKIDVEDCGFSFNGIAVTSDGFGGCPLADPVQPPTTIVRLNRGFITNSVNFVFEMLNPGGACPNSSAAHGQNIYVRTASSNSDFLTNWTGYVNTSTNFLFVQGVVSGSQILIGFYQPNNQGRQP